MKPQNLTWKKLTADELTRVYLDEMRRDFPPSELKPLSMILNSEAAGMAHTWGVFAEDTLVSYLLMVRPAGCEVSQLDYFSVLPAYRSSGVGAKLLAALPAHEEGAKAILIDAWFRVLVLPAEDSAMEAGEANKALADCYSRVMGEDKWRKYVQLYRPDGEEEKF